MNNTVALDSDAEVMEHRPISPIAHDRVAAAAAAHDALASGEALLVVAGGPAAARAALGRALAVDRLAAGEDVLRLALAEGPFPDHRVTAHLDLPAGAADTALADAIATYAVAETRLVVLLENAERLAEDGLAGVRRLRQADPAARALSVVLMGDDTIGRTADRLLRPSPPGGLRFIRLASLALTPEAAVTAVSHVPSAVPVIAEAPEPESAPAPIDEPGMAAWVPPSHEEPAPSEYAVRQPATVPAHVSVHDWSAPAAVQLDEEAAPDDGRSAMPAPHEWQNYQDMPVPEPHDQGAIDLSGYAAAAGHDAYSDDPELHDPEYHDHGQHHRDHDAVGAQAAYHPDWPPASEPPHEAAWQHQPTGEPAASYAETAYDNESGGASYHEQADTASYQDAFAQLAAKEADAPGQRGHGAPMLRRSEIISAVPAAPEGVDPAEPAPDRPRMILPFAGLGVLAAIVAFFVVRTLIGTQPSPPHATQAALSVAPSPATSTAAPSTVPTAGPTAGPTAAPTAATAASTERSPAQPGPPAPPDAAAATSAGGTPKVDAAATPPPASAASAQGAEPSHLAAAPTPAPSASDPAPPAPAAATSGLADAARPPATAHAPPTASSSAPAAPPAPPTQEAMAQPAPPPPPPAIIAPSPPAGPGLLVIAKADDTLHSLYGRVYKGLQAPPFEVVAAMNPHEIKLGDVVVFPAPPGGWRRLPNTAGR